MIALLLAGTLMAQDQRPTHIDKFMTTRWSQEAIEGKAWHEYPRPQMVRNDWQNLNGMWEYAVTPKDAAKWSKADGEIRVPYPIQSHLSGVQKPVYEDQALWYRRTVSVPDAWKGQRVKLNFGAVDWDTTVYVNGVKAGEHQGGYDPFSFDITDFLKAGENELTLRVWDPTDKGDQPFGKQTFTPNGIWYTAVTGIWQTVWMEPVPEQRIESVSATTKTDGAVRFSVGLQGMTAQERGVVKVEVFWKGDKVGTAEGLAGGPVSLVVPDPHLWSPDSPALYDARVSIWNGDKELDHVETYFGIREIEIKKDEFGPRVYLNHKPVFMFGTLDQGWWPDGLYTPPTDDAMRYDIEYLKLAGFNTVRKHIKLEPMRYYRYCDELGILVWQDMPSNLHYGPGWNTDSHVKNEKPDGPRPEASKRRWEAEWAHIMEAARPFPSIVVWVPFNEAWGQFDTKRIADWTKQNDPTRLVDSASGGNFVEAGDLLDIHSYPGPSTPDRQPERAIVLGEFGGLGLPVKGNTWQADKNWGYRNFDDPSGVMERYEQLINKLVLLKSSGLSGAIYTQTTDVEIEVNGFLTYDRAISKMPVDFLRRVNMTAYQTPGKIETVLATADEKPSEWQYTFSNPGSGWQTGGGTGWKTGMSGFGTPETPNTKIGTRWDGKEIWIRKDFEMSGMGGKLWMKLYHDDNCEVYVNGKLITKLDRWTTDYEYFEVPKDAFHAGKNTIAIYCYQDAGGQYIDAGFVRQVPAK